MTIARLNRSSVLRRYWKHELDGSGASRVPQWSASTVTEHRASRAGGVRASALSLALAGRRAIVAVTAIRSARRSKRRPSSDLRRQISDSSGKSQGARRAKGSPQRTIECPSNGSLTSEISAIAIPSEPSCGPSSGRVLIDEWQQQASSRPRAPGRHGCRRYPPDVPAARLARIYSRHPPDRGLRPVEPNHGLTVGGGRKGAGFRPGAVDLLGIALASVEPLSAWAAPELAMVAVEVPSCIVVRDHNSRYWRSFSLISRRPARWLGALDSRSAAAAGRRPYCGAGGESQSQRKEGEFASAVVHALSTPCMANLLVLLGGAMAGCPRCSRGARGASRGGTGGTNDSCSQQTLQRL